MLAEAIIGKVAWLDSTVTIELVGGGVILVVIEEAPPAQVEIIKTRLRMINNFIEDLCMVDFLGHVWWMSGLVRLSIDRHTWDLNLREEKNVCCTSRGIFWLLLWR
jgi:hypothetical protein